MYRTQFLLPSNHDITLESPRILYNDRYADSMLFAGSDSLGNKLILYLFRKSTIIQTNIYLQTSLGTEYHESDTNLRETDDWYTISARLECCEPMNTWRIVYNAAIRKVGSREFHHVKINLLWHPSSATTYFDKNRRLSFTTHRRLLLKNEAMFKLQKGYEQWGTLHGMIQISEQEPIEVNLRGLKKRFWSLGTKNFMSIILFSDTILSSFTSSVNLRTGHIYSLRKHEIVTECDLKHPLKIPDEILFEFSAYKSDYKMNTTVHHPSLVNFANVQIHRIENNFTGNKEEKWMEGFLLSFRKLTKRASIYKSRIFPSLTVSSECVVELDETVCWAPELVGGKASSLSKIKYFFSNNLNDMSLKESVRLPKSIFLTSNAMDLYLLQKENNSLRERMERLGHGFYEAPKSLLISVAETSLQEEWENSVFSEELFDILFWKIDPCKRYAVRSSALYEDTCDVSAAGLHSSFFDVQGILSVTEAIKKCWASAYSMEALQYRRDNGIPLTFRMGIIIQEMVDVDLYGVLFTCQPSSNDPRIVSIDINSGSVNKELLDLENPVIINKQDLRILFSSNRPATDPRCDTSIISSSDDDDDDDSDSNYFQCEESLMIPKVPRKRQKMRKINVRKQFLKLTEVCLKFESIFSQIVNVEWGFINEEIYIFQCRPVTTLFTWSDFEVSHELDSSFTEFDAITFHNHGEISCDITTPLSITFVNRIMERASNFNRKQVVDAYHKKILSVTQFHAGIDVCNGVFVHVFPEIPFSQRLIDMVMCGQIIVTEELNKLAKERNGISNSLSMFCTMVHIFKLLMQHKRNSSRAEKLAQEFKIDSKKYSCPESLFDLIIQKAEFLLKIADYHFKVSNTANILKCVTLWFMAVGEEENLQKHVHNLSVKLEDVNTMSSKLPALLKEIASLIEKYDKGKEYLHLSPTEKLQFYENYPRIQSKMQYLMKTFGFRCVKEMDLMSETWSMNLTPILESVDTFISKKDELGCATTTQTPDFVCSRRYGKIVNHLITRTKGVLANRERTKKSLALVLHQFRLAFLQLGSLLAQDGVIPSTNLVFYYTMSELKQIIENGSTRSVLHKGYRRYRIWNQLESLQFDDVIIGLPHPIERNLSYASTCVLRGMAASYHCAIGKAHVLLGKSTMKNVSPRDIVVTRNIDIGWSLYFPIIAGLVTEFGGIMSHGAITARECGLPCIVGVKNATSCIETGDIISINGIDGIVSKLL